LPLTNRNAFIFLISTHQAVSH